jgi:hypothetical protein
MFMAQPIILDYVKGMRNNASILKEFNANAEQDLVDSLIEKYGGTEYDSDKHSRLADFTGMDASNKMFELIRDGITADKSGLYQAAILEKFMYLKNIEKPLSEIKQLLNIDSKGFHRNMYINNKRLDSLYDMGDSLVLNAQNLFGNYIETDNNLYIEPTTTAGFDNIFGTKNLMDSFGKYFIESNKALEFDKIIKQLQDKITGKEYKSDKKLYEIKEAYKTYLLSNLNVDNVDDLRKELFLAKDKNSLYQRLLRLKKTKYGKDNRFINNIEVNYLKSLEIDFNNSGGDSFDQTLLYKSFIDLFRDSKDRDGIVLSDIAEELVLYSILRGGNKAQQFIKFIPVSVINKLINIPDRNYDTTVFIDQYMRHNPDEATLVSEFERVSPKVIKLVSQKGKYIRVENNKNDFRLYKQSTTDNTTYTLIDILGIDGTDEYTPYYKSDSIFAINSVNKQNVKGLTNPLMDKEVIETELIETPTYAKESTFDKLNFSSSTSLIESIVNLEDEYPTESKIAKSLLPYIDKSMKVNVIQEGNSNYDTDNNEINIAKVEENNRGTVITVLHEMLHSLSSGVIKKFENNETLPSNIREAIVRLNGFKNQIIDKLSLEQKHNLDWLLAKYAMTWSKTPGRLDYMLSKKTLHPSVRSIITRVKDFTKDIANSTDTDLSALLSEELDLNTTEQKFYYSLTNLDEFISIAGSFDKVRDGLMRVSGNTYIDKIKTFFKQLLDYLGIKDEETQKFLDDIFVVVSKDKVVQEPKVTSINKEVIQGMRKTPISFTEDQNNALTKVANFIDSTRKYFLLAGYAGTGKTTIIENIFNYASSKNRTYVLAPTNTAVKVLRSKMKFLDDKNSKTIHSMLYGEMIDGKFYPAAKIEGATLIIDESSMIDSKVLEDLQNEIGNGKIIFIGDGFQLEPVGANPQLFTSNIFDKEDKVELKRVMRTASSPLLDFATYLRNTKNLVMPTQTEGNLILEKDVAKVKSDYLADLKANKSAIYITATNKDRVQVNNFIRKGLGKKGILEADEQLIAIGNTEITKNGEIFKLSDHIKNFDINDLKPVNISLLNRKTNSYIKQDAYLYSVSGLDSVNIDYVLLFPNTEEASIVPQQIEQAWKDRQADVFFKEEDKQGKEKLRRFGIIATYGYAITAHKSQGSQVDNAYVNQNFVFGDNPARWLYTAITRASKKTILVDNVSLPKVSKLTIDAANTSSLAKDSIEEDIHLTELEEQGKELIEKCKGSAPIAKKGMRTSLSKGHRWSIVKDLKGLPTHEQGGVDLSITNGKVHFTNGKGSVHAKHGMKIPKRVTESLDETKKSDTFTKGLEWYPTEMKCGGYAERGAIIPRKKKDVEPLNSNSWSIIEDLKGKSHEQGGINLDITDGKVHFIRGKSKIHARCGCQIRNTSKVSSETIKTNKQKFGRK